VFKDLHLDITIIKHKPNMHITSTKLVHRKHKEQENIKTGKHKLDKNDLTLHV